MDEEEPNFDADDVGVQPVVTSTSIVESTDSAALLNKESLSEAPNTNSNIVSDNSEQTFHLLLSGGDVDDFDIYKGSFADASGLSEDQIQLSTVTSTDNHNDSSDNQIRVDLSMTSLTSSEDSRKALESIRAKAIAEGMIVVGGTKEQKLLISETEAGNGQGGVSNGNTKSTTNTAPSMIMSQSGPSSVVNLKINATRKRTLLDSDLDSYMDLKKQKENIDNTPAPYSNNYDPTYSNFNSNSNGNQVKTPQISLLPPAKSNPPPSHKGPQAYNSWLASRGYASAASAADPHKGYKMMVGKGKRQAKQDLRVQHGEWGKGVSLDDYMGSSNINGIVTGPGLPGMGQKGQSLNNGGKNSGPYGGPSASGYGQPFNGSKGPNYGPIHTNSYNNQNQNINQMNNNYQNLNDPLASTQAQAGNSIMISVPPPRANQARYAIPKNPSSKWSPNMNISAQLLDYLNMSRAGNINRYLVVSGLEDKLMASPKNLREALDWRIQVQENNNNNNNMYSQDSIATTSAIVSIELHTMYQKDVAHLTLRDIKTAVALKTFIEQQWPATHWQVKVCHAPPRKASSKLWIGGLPRDLAGQKAWFVKPLVKQLQNFGPLKAQVEDGEEGGVERPTAWFLIDNEEEQQQPTEVSTTLPELGLSTTPTPSLVVTPQAQVQTVGAVAAVPEAAAVAESESAVRSSAAETAVSGATETATDKDATVTATATTDAEKKKDDSANTEKKDNSKETSDKKDSTETAASAGNQAEKKDDADAKEKATVTGEATENGTTTVTVTEGATTATATSDTATVTAPATEKDKPSDTTTTPSEPTTISVTPTPTASVTLPPPLEKLKPSPPPEPRYLAYYPRKNCAFVTFVNKNDAIAARNHLYGLPMPASQGVDTTLNVDFVDESDDEQDDENDAAAKELLQMVGATSSSNQSGPSSANNNNMVGTSSIGQMVGGSSVTDTLGMNQSQMMNQSSIGGGGHGINLVSNKTGGKKNRKRSRSREGRGGEHGRDHDKNAKDKKDKKDKKEKKNKDKSGVNHNDNDSTIQSTTSFKDEKVSTGRHTKATDGLNLKANNKQKGTSNKDSTNNSGVEQDIKDEDVANTKKTSSDNRASLKNNNKNSSSTFNNTSSTKNKSDKDSTNNSVNNDTTSTNDKDSDADKHIISLYKMGDFCCKVKLVHLHGSDSLIGLESRKLEIDQRTKIEHLLAHAGNSNTSGPGAKKSVSVFHVRPLARTDIPPHADLCNYFTERKRVGLVQTANKTQFYLVPCDKELFLKDMTFLEENAKKLAGDGCLLVQVGTAGKK